jgi:hypothetical protein
MAVRMLDVRLLLARRNQRYAMAIHVQWIAMVSGQIGASAMWSVVVVRVIALISSHKKLWTVGARAMLVLTKCNRKHATVTNVRSTVLGNGQIGASAVQLAAVAHMSERTR